MVDYAGRLTDRGGSVSARSSIVAERERRTTESVLASLTETVEARCETSVSRSFVASVLERNGAYYDLVSLGASTDRSVAS